jgi:hypothetical protein
MDRVCRAGTGIVVAPSTNQVAREKTLRHETVHALMRQLDLDRRAPVWFKEGMAVCLATTSYEESSDKVTFGEPDLEALKYVAHRGFAPWHDLWVWSEDPLEKARLYSTSWLLVHYLFNHERERFQRQFPACCNCTMEFCNVLIQSCAVRRVLQDHRLSTERGTLRAHGTQAGAPERREQMNPGKIAESPAGRRNHA